MKQIFNCPKGTNGTVTWNANKWTFVLTKEHFHNLVDELVDEDVSYKGMFTLDVTLRTSLVDKVIYEKIQSLLDTRLTEKVKLDPSILLYKFKGKDAQKHIVSFLETYCYYGKNISYDTIYMHDNSDKIIQIKQRQKQTILDKLAGRLGKASNIINFPITDVKKIKGSPLKFTLTLTSGSIFHFGDAGVIE